MKEYLVTETEISKLGLNKKNEENLKSNKIIVAFTILDLDFPISEEMIEVFKNWFYKTYYDSFKESFERFFNE